jgi:hypothetical protein
VASLIRLSRSRIIAAVCVVSTALVLLWLLAMQRYLMPRRKERDWGRGK